MGTRVVAEGDIRFSAFGGSPANNKKGTNDEQNPYDPVFAFLTGASYIPLSADICNAVTQGSPAKPAQLVYQSMMTGKSSTLPPGVPAFVWYLATQWYHDGVLDQSHTSLAVAAYNNTTKSADEKTLVSEGIAVHAGKNGGTDSPRLARKMADGTVRYSIFGLV